MTENETTKKLLYLPVQALQITAEDRGSGHKRHYARSATVLARGKFDMREVLLTAVVAMFGGSTAAAVTAQTVSQSGDPQAGRNLALQKCDVCHIVASDQEIRPLVSHFAPSFYDIANEPGTTTESLETFLAKPHAFEIMPYPELSPAQVTNLVSYILSLRGRPH